MIIKSTNGNGAEYHIRKAIENKKHWVVEVFFCGRSYPNIVSGRYKRLKDAKNAISEYQHNESFNFWGNI
jgi:hypothetical protein